MTDDEFKVAVVERLDRIETKMDRRFDRIEERIQAVEVTVDELADHTIRRPLDGSGGSPW